MSECADERYRVQISGPRFSVSHEVGPDEDDLDPDQVHFAAFAISGALTMASYNLPRVTQILAEVVSKQLRKEACHIETVREAEAAFRDAAERMILAWDEHDERQRRAVWAEARPLLSPGAMKGST